MIMATITQSSPTAEHHEHPPHLQHHFETPLQQFESGKLGMWIFLATEILFFGGLFVAYAVYRANHPEIFAYAHQYLDKVLGGINTVVLICSSLTMAWAVRSAQLSHRRALIVCLILTLLCACGFMGIKFVEYQQKWQHGLLWGKQYHPTVHTSEHASLDPNSVRQESVPSSETTQSATEAAIAKPEEKKINAEEQSTIAPAALGPEGLAPSVSEPHSMKEPHNVQIFFSIYFAMTGLHGIHVLGGMGVIIWLLLGSFQGRYHSQYFTPVDLVGLYWHLVDLIWIFLFPLLYLIH